MTVPAGTFATPDAGTNMPFYRTAPVLTTTAPANIATNNAWITDFLANVQKNQTDAAVATNYGIGNFGQTDTPGGYAHGYTPPGLINNILHPGQSPATIGANGMPVSLIPNIPDASQAAAQATVPGTIDPATGLNVPAATDTHTLAGFGGQVDPRAISDIVTKNAVANPNATTPAAAPQKGGQGLFSRILAPLNWLGNAVGGLISGTAAKVEEGGWGSLVDPNSFSDTRAAYGKMAPQQQQEFIKELRAQSKGAEADYLEKDINADNPVSDIWNAGVKEKVPMGAQTVVNDIIRYDPAQPHTHAAAWASGIAGFAANVLTDPLTYVGPGLIKAGYNAAKGGVQAATGVTKAVDAAKTAGLTTAIGDIAAKTPNATSDIVTKLLDTKAANVASKATAVTDLPVPNPGKIVADVAAPAAKVGDAVQATRIADTTANATPILAQAGTAIAPVAPVINPKYSGVIDNMVTKSSNVGAYTDTAQAAALTTVARSARSEAIAAGIVEPVAKQAAVGEAAIALLKKVEDAHATTGIKTETGLHLSDVFTATPELRSLANETTFALTKTGDVVRGLAPTQVIAGAQKALDVSTWVPTVTKGVATTVDSVAIKKYAQAKMIGFVKSAHATTGSVNEANLQAGLARNLFGAVTKTEVSAAKLNPSYLANPERLKLVADKMGLNVSDTGKVTYKVTDHPLAFGAKDIVTPVSRDMQKAAVVDAMKAAAPNAISPAKIALINKAADVYLKNATVLSLKTSTRIAATQAKDIADAAALGKLASARIAKVVADPATTTAEVADTLVNEGKTIARDAKGRFASPAAARLAAVQSGAAAKAAGVTGADLRAAQHITAVAAARAAGGAGADAKVAALVAAHAKATIKDAQALVAGLPPAYAAQLTQEMGTYGLRVAAEQTSLLTRFLSPFGFKATRSVDPLTGLGKSGFWPQITPLTDEEKVIRAIKPDGSVFANSFGRHASAKELLIQTKGAASTYTADFENVLQSVNRIDAEFVKTAATGAEKPSMTAFNMIRLGEVPAADTAPTVKAVYDTLSVAYDYSIGLAKGKDTESLLGMAFRGGSTDKIINRYLEGAGIKEDVLKYDLKAAKGDYTVMANQVKDATVKDPIDFMRRYNTAMMQMYTDQTIGIHFSTLGKTGAQMTPLENKTFVKISAPAKIVSGAKAAKNSIALDPAKLHYYDFIDKSLYYPPEALEQMGNVERLANATTGLVHLGGGFGKIIEDFYDPWLKLYKGSVTLARPGHVPKNQISDMLINQLAEGIVTPRPYLEANKALKAGRGLTANQSMKDIYTGTYAAGSESANRLRNLMFGDLSQGEKFGNITLKGGKTVPKTYAEIYKLGRDNGALSSYHSSLDIQVAEEGKQSIANRLATAVTESRPARASGHFAEVSDWQTTMAQFIKLARDEKFTKQFSNEKDMWAAIGARVRSFHPQVAGLSPFEQKYMRRIMPFYSWFRQTAPSILEAGLIHPGRVQMFDKLAFAGGVASGGNPTSLQDPFDSSKIYPSFIRDMESTAPIQFAGNSMGYDLGGPTESIAELTNGNPINNMIHELNPLLVAPIELLTGKQLVMNSGGPIGSTPDYIDRLIPGVNDVANLSGYSPTGTLMNILGNTKAAPSTENPVFSRQQAVLTGNKNTFINLSTLDFLSGLGIENYNQKNMYEAGLQELQSGLYRG